MTDELREAVERTKRMADCFAQGSLTGDLAAALSLVLKALEEREKELTLLWSENAAKDARIKELEERAANVASVCRGVVEQAKRAHAYWDADQDSKVGKHLMALAGYMTGYNQEYTAFHEIIAVADEWLRKREEQA